MAILRIQVGDLHHTIVGTVPNAADVQRILQGLGAAGMQKWKKLAQTNLRSTSRDYAAGLGIEYTANQAIITLEGMLPNMIENGWPGGDMRKWMLQSPKAKMGKNGRYLIVPFRHGTPGTSGRNVGAPMPGSIYQVAKNLAPTISRPGTGGGNTKWGGRLHPGLPMAAKTKKLLQAKAKPHHTTSLFMGMVRKEKTYEGATQSSYSTFRVISEKSNGKGHWIHPGVKAKRFAPQVQAYVEKISAAIIATALGKKP